MTGEIENRVLAEQIVNKGIQEVVFKYNAYAPIISSFRIVYTDLVPTMGVDKYARLVINPDFVVENQAYIKGILIHEVLHIFFGHTSDTRSKLAYTDDPQHNKIANIAEDCAINQFISETLPKSAITPEALHPQSVAPGFQMYTCWMIRHLDGNPWLQTTRNEDEKYRWLHDAKFE